MYAESACHDASIILYILFMKLWSFFSILNKLHWVWMIVRMHFLLSFPFNPSPFSAERFHLIPLQYSYFSLTMVVQQQQSTSYLFDFDFCFDCTLKWNMKLLWWNRVQRITNNMFRFFFFFVLNATSHFALTFISVWFNSFLWYFICALCSGLWSYLKFYFCLHNILPFAYHREKLSEWQWEWR